jgi:hypothetical protein
MVGHQHPPMHYQAFVIYAVQYAVNYYHPLVVSGENIDPSYHCKRNKVAGILLPKFIAVAHLLKIENTFVF